MASTDLDEENAADPEGTLIERPSIIVLGDLCVDTVVDAPDLDVSADVGLSELSYWVPMSDHLGGTAYHFARHVKDKLVTPIVVGCIGDDAAGRFAKERLSSECLRHYLWRTENNSTARTLLIYGLNGTRMMFASTPNANMRLPVEFISSIWSDVSHCSAVWVSGLCLRDRNSDTFIAVRSLLMRARMSSVKVLLDVVPHDFHLYFSSVEEVVAEIGSVDVIVSELA